MTDFVWQKDAFESWDKTEIAYRVCLNHKAKHSVILVHGFGEHGGRYYKFLSHMKEPETKELLAQLAIMDLRGMGESAGKRGDVKCFNDYLEDISAFVKHLQKAHFFPSKIIILGHSLGGLIAFDWARLNPDLVKLLILSSPFIGMKYGGIIRWMNNIVCRIKPDFLYKNFVRAGDLSRSHEVKASYRTDPLIVRKMTSRLLYEILNKQKLIDKMSILSTAFPIHLLMPAEDRTLDIKKTARFFDRLAMSLKRKTVFEGSFHEIFNDYNEQKTFNVLKTIIGECV